MPNKKQHGKNGSVRGKKTEREKEILMKGKIKNHSYMIDFTC